MPIEAGASRRNALLDRASRMKVAFAALAVASLLHAKMSTALAELSTAGSSKSVRVVWRELPLQARLLRWESIDGRPAFRDRRIDPRTQLNLQAEGAPCQLLDEALSPTGYRAVDLGSLVYVGTAQAAAELRTLLLLNSKLPARTRHGLKQTLRQSDALAWPRLTEPRGLIASLLEANGVRLTNPDDIPHDVWNAGGLPAMPLGEKLTLLLYGFECTWSVGNDGASLLVAPLPGRLVFEKSYREGKAARVDEAALLVEFPNAALSQQGRAWRLTGTVEAHERFSSMLSGAPGRASSSEEAREQRLTLRVTQQPVGTVLRGLAAQLGRTLEIDQAVERNSLDHKVNLEVKDTTLEELLSKLGKAAGLEVRQSEKQINVWPKP